MGAVGVVARIKIQAGKEAEAEKVLKDLIAQVKANEPDVIVYDLFKSRKDPSEFVMLEMYANPEALAAHGKMPHFVAAGPKLGPLLAGPPSLEFVDGV
jgi:quinol monooxygenase YgiN